MPRFVLLWHETPPNYGRPPHLDLMLETDGALKTFALPHWPAEDETVACEQLADHRLEYLDYEGELSGGRGSVTRQEAGEYVMEEGTSAKLIVHLRGERLAGTLTLRSLAVDSARWEASWSAGPS